MAEECGFREDVYVCRRPVDHIGPHSIYQDKNGQRVPNLNNFTKPQKVAEDNGVREYYGGPDNPYEAIKVIEAWNLNFNIGTVVKYLSRYEKKDPTRKVEDLVKARWYLDHEIQRIQNEP